VTPRPAPLRLLYIGTVLLILTLLATNAAVILHLRNSELSDETGQLENLSLILAEQAERSFNSVDLVISSVTERIEAESVTDSASFDQKMAGHDIYLLLKEKIIGLPELAAVNLFDSNGTMINSTRSWPIPEVYIADRGFFRSIKQDPTLTSYITEPLQNRSTGTWTIYLAHRVSGPNGEFIGLILGAIEMRYFEDFYQAISSRQGGTIALQRLDGVMLARFPQSGAIGKAFSTAQHLLGDGISGTLREPMGDPPVASFQPPGWQLRRNCRHRHQHPVFHPLLRFLRYREPRVDRLGPGGWHPARQTPVCRLGGPPQPQERNCFPRFSVGGFDRGRGDKIICRWGSSAHELPADGNLPAVHRGGRVNGRYLGVLARHALVSPRAHRGTCRACGAHGGAPCRADSRA